MVIKLVKKIQKVKNYEPSIMNAPGMLGTQTY